MKKVIAGLLMSATVLGLATFATNAVSVHADDTTTTEMPANSSNEATVKVNGGSLSFTTPTNVTLGQTTVEDVYNNGFDAKDVDGGKTTVSDFLGDNGTWTLSAVYNGFGMTNLDGDEQTTLSINGSDALTKDQAVKVASGSVGVSDTPLSYDLHINNNTLLSAKDYTSTITWSMSNQPSENKAE